MTSPLTFNLPPMNSRCAFALPLTSLPKSSSERDRVTVETVVSLLSAHYAAACKGQVLAWSIEMGVAEGWGGSVPVGLSPRPLPTSPLFFRSICQLSVSPVLFFSVNANTAFPCLTASLRSASEAWSAALMASKASEEGNASSRGISGDSSKLREGLIPFLRDMANWRPEGISVVSMTMQMKEYGRL